jgi:hypothetical protein
VAGIVERAMIGKTEGERQLARPRGKRENKNKFIFRTWAILLWSGFVFGYGKLALV